MGWGPAQPDTPPSDSEEFRLRLKIEGNVWLMLASKFPNKTYLQNLSPQDFVRYAEHFLGEKCLNLQVPREGSLEPLRPPWSIVLHYEFNCRKWVLRQAREHGISIKDGLESVVKDAELKELHFTSPIALAGRQRASSTEPPPKKPKGAGKARSTGKGSGAKGKGRGTSAGALLGTAPDGRQICFNYNLDKGCSVKDCPRLHVCRRRGCMGAHPLVECPKK